MITQGQLDNETFPSIQLTDLLAALLNGGDTDSHIITAAELAVYGFFSSPIDRNELIVSEIVTDQQLNDAGLTEDPVNPRKLLAAEIVTPEKLAEVGFVQRTVDKNDLTSGAFTTATGVTITEAELVNAGLLQGGIDPDALLASQLVTSVQLTDAAITPVSLISRDNFDDLPAVDYDIFDLAPVDLARLIQSEIVDAQEHVDLDDLLETDFPNQLPGPVADLEHPGQLEHRDTRGC